MNAMPGESRALDRAADVYAQVQESGSRVQSAVSPFFGLTEYAGLVVVLVVGGWFTLHGTLTIGAMVAFLAYMEILAEPLTRLGATIPALQTSAAAVDRISGVLNQQEPELAAGTSDALSYAVLHGAVQLQDVSFSYTRGGSDSLHGISFCIQPGSRIALIGRNGAGKSTLLELLLKLHTPTSGTISVGGQDLQQLDTRAWRTHVGVMPQEVVVLNRSIAANISLGLGGEVDVRTAARRAGLEDAILALPQQYHTVIGERGVLLSGGMRQRLAIARLLARNPGILLLDEPTSALDLEAEAELLPVINNLCQGRTTIIISHRVALLTDVDSVLLLDAGRLVAHKTPGQAWEAHPDFHDLFPPAWSLCARRG